MLIALLLLLLASVSCSSPARPPSAASDAGAQATSVSEAVAPVAANTFTTVPAIVTGVLQRSGMAVEICPGASLGPCPGIRLLGNVDPAWISSKADKVSVWRLHGAYDGTSLILDGPALATDLAQRPDYRNTCPEFQTAKHGGNPDGSVMAAAQSFVSAHQDRVAGHWWDAQHQAMVVFVTGDAEELKASLRRLAPGARVCLQGGARFAEHELESARERANRLLSQHDIVWSSSSLDVVKNEVVYEADVIDAEALAQLALEAGEAIRVIAFITLPKNALTELPAPTLRGDIALVAKKTRSGAGMSALGRFTLRYDQDQACMYFDDAQGRRVLPVWPFGYWASSAPMQVFDFDDAVVASVGDSLELGGGQVDIEHVRTEHPCGATRAWISTPGAVVRKPNGLRSSACDKDGTRVIELPESMSVRGPCALQGVPVQGIDSKVGRFAMPGCTLEYSLGAYSSSLGEWATQARYERAPTTLDGLKAELIRAHRAKPGKGERAAWLAGIYVPNAPGGQKLTLYSECTDEAGHARMLKLLRTLLVSR